MERPLVTGARMQAVERRAIERGLTSLALMEVAARAVADLVEARFDPRVHREVVALAGPGNNGGDAVAAARLLRDRGLPVRAILVADPARIGGDLAHQVRLHGPLESPGIEAILAAIGGPVLVIDGLFGTGLGRPLEGDARRLAEALADDDDQRGPGAGTRTVVAIDIPSGIDAATGQILGAAVRADVTITFQVPKLGHYVHPGRAHRGELQVADIGVPLAAFTASEPAADPDPRLLGDDVLEAVFPARAATAHKGAHGHLMVVAGHPDRPGSALLAARAALRSGAALVTIATDRDTLARLAPVLDELMGLDVGGPGPAHGGSGLDAERVLAALDARKTALVIGPSLDARDDTAVRTILHLAAVPVVVDAGALHTVAADPAVIRARTAPTILTPHPGEMAHLTGRPTMDVQSDRFGVARSLARELRAFVVLKGASTVVAAPDGRLALVPTGNPGMATAGTGDVLAGIIGGLLAQRTDPWRAACAGAYLHGLAGDLARDARGETSLVASDVIDHLGPALRAVQARAAQHPWPRGRWPSTQRGAGRGHAP